MYYYIIVVDVDAPNKIKNKEPVDIRHFAYSDSYFLFSCHARKELEQRKPLANQTTHLGTANTLEQLYDILVSYRPNPHQNLLYKWEYIQKLHLYKSYDQKISLIFGQGEYNFTKHKIKRNLPVIKSVSHKIVIELKLIIGYVIRQNTNHLVTSLESLWNSIMSSNVENIDPVLFYYYHMKNSIYNGVLFKEPSTN